MFEWAPGITILDNMIGNEDEGYDEEKYEDKLVKKLWKRLLSKNTWTSMHIKAS